MRYQIFGRDQQSGERVAPFVVDADDEQDARNRAAEMGTMAERVQAMGTSEPLSEDKPLPTSRLIVTTGNEVVGHSIVRYLGVVRGIVVRSPSISQGFFGGLQQMFGGNIEAYAEVCEAARQEAFERMVKHAEEAGADAIIAMRYDATEFSASVTEVLAYGTAVKLGRGPAGRG
jgi:uncharacterized protein YbjQ (UPF0145 family)